MTTRIKKAAITTALLTLLAIGARPGYATETDVVTVGDVVVMRLRAGANGYSPDIIGNAIRRRLAAILNSPDIVAPRVSVRQEQPNQDALLYVNDRLLVRVDRGLTEANGMRDPRDLARLWARNLRRALPSAMAAVRANPASATSLLWDQANQSVR